MPHEALEGPVVRAVPLVAPEAEREARILTPSMIALYDSCPRHYAFRYEEGVPADFYPAALAFGRSLHAAVEDLCSPPPDSGSPVERAQSRFLEVHRKECLLHPVRFDDGDSASAAERLGLHLVEVFARVFPREEVAACEVPFQVPLGRLLTGKPKLMLRGRIDLRLRDGSIGELKTSRRGLKPQYLPRSAQLRSYVLAVALTEGPRPPVQVIELRKEERDDVLRIHRLTFESYHLRGFLRLVEQMLRAIERGLFPRKVGPLCAWCEYQTPCLGGDVT